MIRRLIVRWWFPGWLLLASCSAAQHAPQCNGIRREELTALYLADIALCQDQACLDRATGRHTARRQQWVECGGDNGTP